MHLGRGKTCLLMHFIGAAAKSTWRSPHRLSEPVEVEDDVWRREPMPPSLLLRDGTECAVERRH
eukprot:12678251-Prorocentrum_lima.AAC.1